MRSTFEESLDDYIRSVPQTNYERERGIVGRTYTVMHTSDDLKLVVVDKTDGTKTLLLFFNASIKTPTWLYWCPSEEQLGLFNVVADAYELIDTHNRQVRRRA